MSSCGVGDMKSFADRAMGAIDSRQNIACVGLDPRLDGGVKGVDDERTHQYLLWAARSGVLRKYDVVEASGFGANVTLGAKAIWAHLGKEPLEGNPPMRVLGLFGLAMPYNTTMMRPLRISKSSGGPLHIGPESESERLVNPVKFNGEVLSIFESSVEMIVRSGQPEGYLSLTVAIDVGDACVELIVDDSATASLRIGEHLEGIVYPTFTPAYFLGVENMRGIEGLRGKRVRCPPVSDVDTGK